jgi:long-subunit acyl-CoA synthetase (AMP-forming)
MKTLIERLARFARFEPGRIALCSEGDCLTYAELYRDVARVAHLLRRDEVESLGLYLDNGIEWVVVDLAAIVAGVRVTPLPWFFSDAQLAHATAQSAIDHIVYGEALPGAIEGAGLAPMLYGNCRLRRVAGAAPERRRRVRGEKLSFTSGTTGNPKGIRLDNAFLEQICIALDRVTADLAIGRHLGVLPYSTLLENLAGIYLPLFQGKTVCAEPAAQIGLTPDLGLNPAALAACLERTRPNSLILTPQLLDALCALAEAGFVDTGTLEFVAVGGARVPPALLERASAAGIPAYQGYGLTEFGSVAILNTPDCNRPGSVGKPLPGIAVEIAADGEILLGSANPKSTAPDRRNPRGQVATGDYGHIDADGFVHVHGRKSNVIVLPSGRNVSPEWVEAELNTSPAIGQSYVYAGASGLSALIVAAKTDSAPLRDEIERINLALPAYARIGEWRLSPAPFSRDNQLLTANGRLRRDRIRSVLPNLLQVSPERRLNH